MAEAFWRHAVRLSRSEYGNGLFDGTGQCAVAATPPQSRMPIEKRLLDIGLAALALVLLAPLMVVVAALVRATSPGPVLFRQVRIGLNEQPFVMFKFRTMRAGCSDEPLRELNLAELQGSADPGTSDGVFKLENDPRVTAVGRVLRRFSIDELPQLFNVLRGEMSLVGPRPALPWEVELFTPEQRRRHECVPGITGLWQVSGRNRLSMPDMLDLDLLYVARRSMLLDLWILLRTPFVVLFDEGAR
jgi:lipopolysaccharide/colanic/teichoic acid biosynthesis glycosyltransferase